MKSRSFLCILALCFVPFLAFSSEPFVVGEVLTIQSKVLGKETTINIKLPSSYEGRKDKRYPVYYGLGTDGGFISTVGTIDALSHNQEHPMPETIIVTLSTDTAVTIIERGVKSEDFINLLVVDVIPYIEQHYRTHPFKILVSGARFGQAPFYALMHHTAQFQAYINISPWTKDTVDLIDEFENFLKENRNLKAFLWLSSGGERRVTPEYDKLVSVLEQNAPKGLDWKSTKYEAVNDMAQSLVSLPNALVTLFSDRTLSQESATFKSGGNAIKNYYKQISEQKYGYPISAERTLSILGLTYLRDKEMEQAIEVLKMNIQEYPNSPHVYAGLARAYMFYENFSEALPLQKKAYKLAAEQKSEYEDYYKQILTNIETELSSK